MLKMIPTIILVCLFSGFSFSQSESLSEKELKNQPIDSSLAWMRDNLTTGVNLEAFHAIGLNTLQRGLKTKNDSLIAQIHESLASWHAYNGLFSPDSVVYHAEKALNYHLQGDDKKKNCRYL